MPHTIGDFDSADDDDGDDTLVIIIIIATCNSSGDDDDNNNITTNDLQAVRLQKKQKARGGLSDFFEILNRNDDTTVNVIDAETEKTIAVSCSSFSWIVVAISISLLVLKFH